MLTPGGILALLIFVVVFAVWATLCGYLEERAEVRQQATRRAARSRQMRRRAMNARARQLH